MANNPFAKTLWIFTTESLNPLSSKLQSVVDTSKFDFAITDEIIYQISIACENILGCLPET